jgi:CRP/FNR family transcriptional regulator
METSTADALRRLPVFSRLSDEALTAVASRTVTKRLRRNAVLFRRGAPCQGLYVVLAGRVRVYRANSQGREQTLHVQGPGQSIAEVPLFDGGPYPASARAEEDSIVLFLAIDDFQWLYRNHPEIADSVIRELGRRLRRMVSLVEKISLRDVPARMAMTLLEYAERKAGEGGGRELEFTLSRTQEELAAELATTRESIARALSRMRQEGVIDQRGAEVRILDLPRLERLAYTGAAEPCARTTQRHGRGCRRWTSTARRSSSSGRRRRRATSPASTAAPRRAPSATRASSPPPRRSG